MVPWRTKATAKWAEAEDIDVGTTEVAQTVEGANKPGFRRHRAGGSDLVWTHKVCEEVGISLYPYSATAGDNLDKADDVEYSPYSLNTLVTTGHDVNYAMAHRGINVPYMQQYAEIKRIVEGESIEIEGPQLSGKTTTMLLGVLLRLLARPASVALVMVSTKPEADFCIEFLSAVLDTPEVALCNSRPVPPGVRVAIGTTTHVNATFRNTKAVDLVAADNGVGTARQNRGLVNMMKERGAQFVNVLASQISTTIRHQYLDVPDKMETLVGKVEECVQSGERCLVYTAASHDDVVDALDHHEHIAVVDDSTHAERYVQAKEFREGDVPLLIAQDSLPHAQFPVTHIFMADPPRDAKEYLARCGRMRNGCVTHVFQSREGQLGDDGSNDGSGGDDDDDDSDDGLTDTQSARATSAPLASATGSEVDVAEILSSVGSVEDAGLGLSEEGLLAAHAAQLHVSFDYVERGKLDPLVPVVGNAATAFDEDFEYTDKAGTFSGMMLHSDLLRGMSEVGLSSPSPIQARALPATKTGADIILQSATGTGKSTAMCMSFLQRLQFGVTDTQVIYFAATQEAADQAALTVIKLSRHQRTDLNVCLPCYPGKEESLSKTTRVLIVTPEMADQLPQRLPALSVVVVDDASFVFTSSYGDRVIDFIKKRPATDPHLQLMVATTDMPPEVLETAMDLASDDVKVVRCNPRKLLPPLLKHFVHKAHVKEVALSKVLAKLNTKTLVFCEDKSSVESVSKSSLEKIHHVTYHSGMTSEQKSEALKSYKKKNVLVVDGALAMSFDLPSVRAVVNFDPPLTATDYLLKAGRAARFGGAGAVVNLVDAVGLQEAKAERTEEEKAEARRTRQEEWAWTKEYFAPYSVPAPRQVHKHPRPPREREALHKFLKDKGMTSGMIRFISRLGGESGPSIESGCHMPMLRHALREGETQQLTQQEVQAVAELLRSRARKNLESHMWRVLDNGLKSLCSPVMPVKKLSTTLKKNADQDIWAFISKEVAQSFRDSMETWVAMRTKQRKHIRALWALWQESIKTQWEVASTSLTGLRPKKKRFGAKKKDEEEGSKAVKQSMSQKEVIDWDAVNASGGKKGGKGSKGGKGGKGGKGAKGRGRR